MRQIIGRCHLSLHEWCFCSCPLLPSKMPKSCSSREHLKQSLRTVLLLFISCFPGGTADPSFRFPGGIQSSIWGYCCLLQAPFPCSALPVWFWFILVVVFMLFFFFFSFFSSPFTSREICLLCSPGVVNRSSINSKKNLQAFPFLLSSFVIWSFSPSSKQG